MFSGSLIRTIRIKLLHMVRGSLISYLWTFLHFLLYTSIKLKTYSKGLSSSKRGDCWNKNIFDECFNDNKPYGINTKFYEWWSTDVCT